jgi:hypothetical protein
MIKKITDWRTWLRGLGAAVIGGASNAITLLIVDPTEFNLDDGLGRVWKVAAVSAILSAAFYLKQSPIPPRIETTEPNP